MDICKLLILLVASAVPYGCGYEIGAEGDLFLLQRRAKSVEADRNLAPLLAQGVAPFRFWGHNVAILNDRGLRKQVPELYQPAGPDQTYNLQNKDQFSHSQWGQDRILEPILSKLGTGFFIESGAFDGETHSNTLMYEMKYHWSGLLVEPDYRMLQPILAKHRKAYLFDGCLSPTGQATSLEFNVGPAGLSSLDGSQTTDESSGTDPQNTPNISGPGSETTPQNSGPDSGSYPVEAQPLHSLLEAIGRETVDFWSLDIEGSEGAVLQTTDFSRVEVGVILIEMNKDLANNDKINNVMSNEGFINIGHTNYIETGRRDVLDQIFVNPKYFNKRSLPVPTKELLPPENRNDFMP